MSLPRKEYFILFDLSPKEWSWRGIYYLAVLFLGSIFFAAIVSPWVYWGFEIWNKVYPNATIQYILDKGLDKTFDRIRWIPVLIFFPLLLWRVHLSSAKRLGLNFQSKNVFTALKWFLIGIGMFVSAAFIQYHFAIFDLRVTFDNFKGMLYVLGSIIAKAFLAAFIIGILEEIVFRGMIFRFFYTAVRPELSVILSALFFAWVHFKDIPNGVMGNNLEATWVSGFTIAFWTLLSFTQTLEWVPFLNLFLTGIILSLVFLKTGSLWPCVGLHAGWVCALMLHRDFFRAKSETTNLWSGSHGIIDGLLASSMLTLGVIVLIASMYRNHEIPRFTAQRCCESGS